MAALPSWMLLCQGLDEKDEVSEEEEEEEDDDFMRSYRESRLKEMARLSQLWAHSCFVSLVLSVVWGVSVGSTTATIAGAITPACVLFVSPARPRFGVVREIGQLDLVSETDDEDKRVWVIIHLYEDVRAPSPPACVCCLYPLVCLRGSSKCCA